MATVPWAGGALTGTGARWAPASVAPPATATATLSLFGSAALSSSAGASMSLSGSAAPSGVSGGSASLALTGSSSAAAGDTGSAALELTAAATAGAADSATGVLTLVGTGTGTSQLGAAAELDLTATGGASATETGSAALTLTGSASGSAPDSAAAQLYLSAAGAGTSSNVGVAALTLVGSASGAGAASTAAQLALAASAAGAGAGQAQAILELVADAQAAALEYATLELTTSASGIAGVLGFGNAMLNFYSAGYEGQFFQVPGTGLTLSALFMRSKLAQRITAAVLRASGAADSVAWRYPITAADLKASPGLDPAWLAGDGGPWTAAPVVRWRFEEESSGAVITLPFNPDKAANPFPQRQFDSARGFRNGQLGTRSFPHAPVPTAWQFSGPIRTQDHHDLLVDWCAGYAGSRPGVIRVTDHLGQTFRVMFEDIQITERQPTRRSKWRFTYVAKAKVLGRV